MQKKIAPPFSLETALAKVKAAEDAWNSRDPERVALAYTIDSQWRNRTEFFTGRDAVKEFSPPQMGQRAGLSFNEGAMGLYRQSDLRTFRV